MGTAVRVARDVGIDKAAVWAGISPQGKKELIQQMQEQGDVVAMVHRLSSVTDIRSVTESMTHQP